MEIAYQKEIKHKQKPQGETEEQKRYKAEEKDKQQKGPQSF